MTTHIARARDSLADRAEIGDCIALGCHAFDRRRWELFDYVFHSDATLSAPGGDQPWRTWLGDTRADVEAGLDVSLHQLGSMLIAMDGDKAQAETYVNAYLRVRSSSPKDSLFPGTGVEYNIFAGGRYVDQFEKRAGKWRIARRTLVGDWRDSQAINDAGLAGVRKEMRGGFGTEDEQTLRLISKWLELHAR
jgi:SnoaL-like domain